MADTTPSQDPRKAFEHHCKTIGIDGSALERWEDGQYMRSHVQLMWQAYQWRADAAPQPNAAADGWMDIATHDGRDEDVQLFCADTGEQFVGFPSASSPGTFQYGRAPGVVVLVCRPTHWRPTPAPPTLNASKGQQP